MLLGGAPEWEMERTAWCSTLLQLQHVVKEDNVVVELVRTAKLIITTTTMVITTTKPSTTQLMKQG